METVRKLRRLGTLIFGLMWVPFICTFAGQVGEMGALGRGFAGFVDRFLPGLLTASPSGLSTLSSVSFVLTFVLMFASFALIFGTPVLTSRINRRILQTGLAAQAELTSLENTGTYINNEPLVRFHLEVRPEGERPFQAEAERIVSYTQMARFQPGTMLPVRYDPKTLDVALED